MDAAPEAALPREFESAGAQEGALKAAVRKPVSIDWKALMGFSGRPETVRTRLVTAQP